MHPTIDAQLRGADRLIEKAASDGSLSNEAAELLMNARRLIGRVARSWNALAPFYERDNRALVELLAQVAPVVPALQYDLNGAVSPPIVADVTTLAARNEQLRDLLTQGIRALPSTPDGAAARTLIGSYLRQRVETNPA